MKILNMFFSTTGNTAKVAQTISNTVQQAGHHIETVKVKKDLDLDLLSYDLIFVGSGIYEWLPGQPMISLFTKLRRQYAAQGEIKPSAPRRHGKKVVVYCTYGGCHTGPNEALPAVKFMGQLFDHLGFDIVGEWYTVGEYHPEIYKAMSSGGRLGDIRGRPHEGDLAEIAEKVKGILLV
ncbi:MAG: flavodoxin domain-containing protein [Desulfobacca sp.]|nr:flavodoxin domain-containing protein [Desulfobacca sp.]